MARVASILEDTVLPAFPMYNTMKMDWMEESDSPLAFLNKVLIATLGILQESSFSLPLSNITLNKVRYEIEYHNRL